MEEQEQGLPEQQQQQDMEQAQPTNPRVQTGQPLTYRQAKAAAGAAYQAAWRALLQPPSPLEGWIPKPAGLEDFSI